MNRLEHALRADLGAAPAPPAIEVLQRRVVRRRIRWVGGALVLVAVLAGGAVISTITYSRHDDRGRVVATAGSTAAALRTQTIDAEVVTRSDKGFVLLDPNTGRVVRQLTVDYASTSCSMCLSGFRVGDVTVLGDGSTVWALGRDGTIRSLGSGVFAFPSPDRSSIYVSTQNSGAAAVDQRDLHGRRLGGPWTLPPGYDLSGRGFGYMARAVVGGVLVQTIENDTDHTLAIWNPTTNGLRIVGHNRWAVLDTYTAPGASTSTIAWFDTTGCAFPACAVALTDSSTGVTRTIGPPEGFHGYFYGGAFSTDGTRLAAFPSTTPAPPPGQPVRDPAVDLGIIDVATRSVSIVRGSHLGTGSPGAFAAWSPSSNWVVFTAFGDVRVHRQGTSDAALLPSQFTSPAIVLAAP